MTTNRMGLEQTLSDGELTVITDTDHVQCGDAAAMARELLAYRKAGGEPVAYIDDLELNRIKGGDSGVIRTPIYGPGYQDAYIPLYAAPPLAVTVPDGWIKCIDRMPDVGDIVLTSKDGCVNVGEMERSGANYQYFTSVVSGRELPATHWMPLSAAPKSVTNEP